MSPGTILAWAAFAYLLLFAVRYVLAARIFLTGALREVEAQPIDRQRLEPGELRLLALLNDELAAAGFRPLGFIAVTPSVTYFERPLISGVFVNEHIPAYAFVNRRSTPEYKRLVELSVTTDLSGGEIVTVDTPVASTFVPPGVHLEALPGHSVGAVVARHLERVEVARAAANGSIPGRLTLQGAADLTAAGVGRARSMFRERKWVVATSDPRLDRFTLRGAFTIVHLSRRSVAARKRGGGGAPAAGVPVPKSGAAAPSSEALVPSSAALVPELGAAPAPAAWSVSEDDRALRVEADLQAVLQVAEHPETPPGTPWSLIVLVAATAILSFLAMTAFWNTYVAALILAVVAFHEAGHATAMRLFGYRDVHVFFVPLLGAMTVGRQVTRSVRDRMAVLFAGPVPGLWLAVVLLAVDQSYGPVELLRKAALALLILNGLNLLPLTPLDGGRVLEALSGPESVWRPLVHGLSAAGLLALGAYLGDPIFLVLGAAWGALLRRSVMRHRLFRAVAGAVLDRGDFHQVSRAALEVMMTPPYAKWRAATRQVTARTIARLFAESVATPADRRWGAVAYASAWIPVAVAWLLWTS
jgi:Zn-dependent protease